MAATTPKPPRRTRNTGNDFAFIGWTSLAVLARFPFLLASSSTRLYVGVAGAVGGVLKKTSAHDMEFLDTPGSIGSRPRRARRLFLFELSAVCTDEFVGFVSLFGAGLA